MVDFAGNLRFPVVEIEGGLMRWVFCVSETTTGPVSDACRGVGAGPACGGHAYGRHRRVSSTQPPHLRTPAASLATSSRPRCCDPRNPRRPSFTHAYAGSALGCRELPPDAFQGAFPTSRGAWPAATSRASEIGDSKNRAAGRSCSWGLRAADCSLFLLADALLAVYAPFRLVRFSRRGCADLSSPPFLPAPFSDCLGTGASAQQVTLWQFGAGRLAEAEISLSLVPLGTVTDANGGLATTYLFQAVNNQEFVTQVDGTGLVTTETLAVTSSRTIIASASGWFEHLPPVNGVTDFISCGFFNASFGGCFDGNTATTALGNSGVPTPEVFGVSTSIFASATPSATPAAATTISFAFATDSSSLGLPTSPPSTSSKLSKGSAPPGTLVAAILGSIAATVLIAGFLLCFLRRRRLRRSGLYGEKSDAEGRNTIQPFDRGVPAHWSFADPRQSEAFPDQPGERRMHTYNQSASTSHSVGSSGIHQCCR
uniref:Uncharacterized protein n=1 Tax=Mycena chlorophos TaxID=658473 RepID=A0ABQ0L0A3_MYCCL|nr:predicted protein [Mycena chlorophos]